MMKMTTDGERPQLERGNQSATSVWTDLEQLIDTVDQHIDTLTREPRSESAAETSVTDEAQVLPASHGDQRYGVSKGEAECVDSHEVAANAPAANPDQDALPAFLTAQYPRRRSKWIIEEFLASAVGGQRPAPECTVRARVFAAAGAVLLVAIAAASTSMAYLTSWPEGDAASAGRLKQNGFVADAALLDAEPPDTEAVPGQADAVSKPRTVRMTPVKVDRRDAEPLGDVTLAHAAAPLMAAYAPWRSRPSATPAGGAQDKAAPGVARPLADETGEIESARSVLQGDGGRVPVADARESARDAWPATADEPLPMTAPVTLASVEAGSERPPAGTYVTGTPAADSTTIQTDPQDIRALLERANSMVQSGDVASARAMFQQAADTGDAYAAGTSYGSAVISRLPALMMVLNDAAATPDALGSPEEAAVPAQVRPRQHPVSSDQAILSPPKEGKERRPGKSEIQPRARADVARAGPVTTARRFVRTVADRITRRFGP
jgi:hypothetical protein